MKIIPASYEILTPVDGDAVLKQLELYGRTAYKSQDKITEDSAKKFVANIIKSEHESVVEHISLSVRFIVDRGVMAEMTRHRISSFTVSSTRYINFSKDKYGGEIEVIDPCFWKDNINSAYYKIWKESCEQSEKGYFALLAWAATPQEARSVLPNSLATEIIMTANLREWRHFFKLRTSKAAHPQMREVTVPLLKEFQQMIPIIFNDIVPYEEKQT